MQQRIPSVSEKDVLKSDIQVKWEITIMSVMILEEIKQSITQAKLVRMKAKMNSQILSLEKPRGGANSPVLVESTTPASPVCNISENRGRAAITA